MKTQYYIYLALLLNIFYACSKPSDKIGIQPYTGLPKKDLKIIYEALKTTYSDKQVVLLDYKEIPKESFINIKSPRYRADQILKIQQNFKPDSISIIIGITNYDISTTKRNSLGQINKPENKYADWGVFGLGYRPGNSCIASSFRLKTSDTDHYISRLQKVAIHEIGHNLGLKHCENTKCVMTDAVESIITVDNANNALCSKCQNQIK